MFPGIYDFRWDIGHIIFLGVFYSVVAVVIGTAFLALVRAWNTFRTNRVEHVTWHADFEDLPSAMRACRHELSGTVDQRTCENCFDCRHCSDYAKLAAQARYATAAAGDQVVGGFALPSDRLYHRGHTWARKESDGTIAVGLDDFASHILGTPDKSILPEEGAKLSANGTGWFVEKNGVRTRVLSPVDGEVVAIGGEGDDWVIRVKPEGEGDLRHLLSFAEAKKWLLREAERLQLALASESVGPALADGGVPVDDLSKVIPREQFDDVCGMVFLEP
jgi:glycine cleavage system H lipoate-binding protein